MKTINQECIQRFRARHAECLFLARQYRRAMLAGTSYAPTSWPPRLASPAMAGAANARRELAYELAAARAERAYMTALAMEEAGQTHACAAALGRFQAAKARANHLLKIAQA